MQPLEPLLMIAFCTGLPTLLKTPLCYIATKEPESNCHLDINLAAQAENLEVCSNPLYSTSLTYYPLVYNYCILEQANSHLIVYSYFGVKLDLVMVTTHCKHSQKKHQIH